MDAPSSAMGRSDADAPTASNESAAQITRRRNHHRGGRKKRARRKSFAVVQSDMEAEPSGQDPALRAARDDFYQMHHGKLSNTSLESSALLDHREQQPFLRPRRPSMAPTSAATFPTAFQFTHSPSRLQIVTGDGEEEADEDEAPWDECAPLLSHSAHLRGSESALAFGYGSGELRKSRPESRQRDSSREAAEPGSSMLPGA